MASGDNSINDSGSGFVTDGFLAGQWIKTSGFTESANNGVFKISTVAAGKMVLTHGTVTTEAAGDTVTILMGPQITNGVALRTFDIEKEYTQNTTDFALLVGLGINEMTIDIDAEAIITGSFAFLGKDEDTDTSSAVNGTAGAASTDPVMNAVDDVDGIFENATSTDMISLSFTVNNNLRVRPEIANLGPTSLGIGKTSVSGTARMYYENATIMDKYLDWTSSTLAMKATDGNGNSYVVELPEIKYTDGKRLATGRDSDVIADMTFIGVRDVTDDITIRITKFSA